MSLERLREEGLRWVEANKSKRFAGVMTLLTDLYPDDAHFIYELLQNAEDARDRSVAESSGASLVRFTLREDALEFEHNGEGLFTLEDVEQITGIGHSVKRDDPTSIGKFGIGFKAVFSYTDTPEIHSGEFHFCIHDLVVPEEVPPKKPHAGQLATRFIFPFNNPKKPAKKAVAEIERGLRALDDSAQLFLSHIRTIEYSLPDGSIGSVRRTEHEGGHIEICTSHPGGHVTASHWLRFQRDVEVEDEDGQTTTCRIAIAFSLVPEDEKQEGSSKWKIVPLDHGRVSIYFPAEKETSNLRFHLHAPFASTVARDSVRDCPANRVLRDHLASLVADSLARIRDQGMLTMGFLAVLPNPADNLAGSAPFYEPIRLATVEAFQEQPLVPMKYGEHAAAESIFRGPAAISDVLDDDDLIVLIGQPDYIPPMWAANPPQVHQREDRFLDSLEIPEWGWGELARALNQPGADSRRRVESWLAQKSDAWLMRLYALLGEACEFHSVRIDVSSLRIVRVTSGKRSDHVLPREAFFPAEDGTEPAPGTRLVKPTVYTSGRSDVQKKRARSFLQLAGVHPFDAKADIQVKLSRYKERPSRKTSSYRRELTLFVRYWMEHPGEVSLFSNHAFLLGATPAGELGFYKPAQLYLDHPYLETGLSELTTIHGRHAIWAGYQDGLRERHLQDLIAFLRAIGVMHALKVERTWIHWQTPHYDKLKQGWGYVRRTVTSIDEDYWIDDLDKYVVAQTIPSSRLIWNALIRAEAKCATARFRPNQEYWTREADSHLVDCLKRHAWIPDRSGEFRKPLDMTQDDLRADFVFDGRNGLLTAIGFGERARKEQDEYSERSDHAQSIGFASVDEADKMVELAKLMRASGRPFDELVAQVRATVKKEAPAFPRRAVTNPDRRGEQLLQTLSNAAGKQYKQRGRSVRTTRGTVEPKVSLRSWYTNEEEQMICQICHQEMPFRGRDTKHYFEAVEALSDAYFRMEHEAQFLALCPLCAAMYKEFVKQDEDAMEALANALVESEEPEIPLQLGSWSTSLRFVESHFHDIKLILEEIGDEDE